MKHPTAVVLAVITLSASLPAADRVVTVAVEGPTEAKPYTLVRLGPKASEGTQVDWEVSPAESADCERLPDGRLIFTAPPGRYVVRRWAINFDKQTFERSATVVTIGDPKPPEPPTPPTPPEPNDPLAVELIALYAANPQSTKAADLVLLTELYRQAAVLADDPALTTLGQLAGKVSAAGQSLTRDRLPNIRKRIATEIVGVLGDDPDKPLAPDVRSAAKTLFLRIHTCLKQVK